MKQVAKYNLCKGVSTALTIGTPIATLACCGNLFVQRSSSAISAAGIFAILLTLLFAKDKIAEQWKVPSAFVVSAVIFVCILLVENIVQSVKCVCITTMISSGVDELTFKRMYKQIEQLLPKQADAYKKFGFLFTTTSTMSELSRGANE